MLHSTKDDDIEKFNMGEDAPQIVGTIDDRPPELIAREDYNKNHKWKTLGSDETREAISIDTRNKSPKYNTKLDRSVDASAVGWRKSHDASPNRKSDKYRDALSPRERMRNDSSNASSRSCDKSPPKILEKNRDALPSRRRRRNDTPDASPSRSGDSLPHKRNREQSCDVSPPRRPGPERPSHQRGPRDSLDASPRRRGQSPPRRFENARNVSPHGRGVDASSHRQDKPPFHKSKSDRSTYYPPPGPTETERDTTPPRRHQNNSTMAYSRSRPKEMFIQRAKPRSESPPPTLKKMTKTIDGKIAGLQNASALRDENEKFKKREEELYKHIIKSQPDEMEAQVRKTGRRQNLEQNSKKEMENMRKEDERKAVYDRWGKGLKQIEDLQDRVADEIHEQSKPLARYADDADLDDYLKQQCRDGDPMAEYFQAKAKERGVRPCKCTFG